MYHFDAIKTRWKKGRWKLHKNAKSYFHQNLGAAPHETKAVRSLTSHLINKPSKTTETQDTVERNQDELISDIFLWTLTHRRARVGRPARTYEYQLCADTRYSSEDLLGEMDDRDGWRERESGKSMMAARLHVDDLQ